MTTWSNAEHPRLRRSQAFADGPAIRLLGGAPVAVIADLQVRQRDLWVKTWLDTLAALALLLVLAPLMLGIALAVRMSGDGGVIFRQTRRGWCGRSFTVFKFRTMRVPPDGTEWSFQTQRNDARCTRIGRLLRRTSLDELPQLWNVVRGEMSLVGPRPHAEHMHGTDRPGQDIVADYAKRNRVKPGITGWAQVHRARGAIENLDQLRQRVAYDLYYIENRSLWLDTRILVRTVFCFFGENAF